MRIVRPSALGFYLFVAVILGASTGLVGARAMPSGGWLGLIPPVLVAWFGLRRPFRRWRLARQPLPDAWRVWLATHVPFYRHFTEEETSSFERNVRFFLDEHRFEGVQDVEVTDELRLGVAAGAALLLHGRPDWEIPGRRTMLFYPSTFDDAYLASEDASFEGMAHPQGPLIFTRRAVESGWADPRDGYNVVLHELAHLFDFKNLGADGIPSLLDSGSVRAWQGLVRQEISRVKRGDSILDGYAATNPAEFFAVSVENFFERPRQLKHRHEKLYDALVAFFNFDPVDVLARRTGGPATRSTPQRSTSSLTAYPRPYPSRNRSSRRRR